MTSENKLFGYIQYKYNINGKLNGDGGSRSNKN